MVIGLLIPSNDFAKRAFLLLCTLVFSELAKNSTSKAI